MVKIIIDTDIGTNPDDVIAIALAAKSPEIDIEGITIVYGDLKTRAKIANEVVSLANINSKIYIGVEKPLLRKRDIFWLGIEGKEIDLSKEYKYEKTHGVDFIIKTIMENPGQITLVTIGPLTNIAAAIILEPKIIKNVKEIIMMAGVFQIGVNKSTLEKVEHNISSDPEAASIVFESGIKITVVGLDVTRQVSLTKSEKDILVKDSTPFVNLISKMLDNHMDCLKRDYFYLSDSIAMSLLVDPSIVKTKKMKINIKYDERHGTGETVGIDSGLGNVNVALDIDKEKFFKLLKTRVFNK